MKKLLLFSAIAILTCSVAKSQELRIGAKAGVNFASVGGDFTDDYDGRTSFHIGGLVEIPISEKFAVQPELLYSSQGFKVEDSDNFAGTTITYKDVIKLDYINIPIMAKYYIIDGLSAEAGPQFGILVSAKDDYEVSGGGEDESGDDDIKDFYNTLDIGFGFGASYRLNNGVFFSARYVIGLTDITDDDDVDFGPFDIDGYKQRNSVIQLSAGYSF
jgi:outer membrane protein with beta-barrel domain